MHVPQPYLLHSLQTNEQGSPRSRHMAVNGTCVYGRDPASCGAMAIPLAKLRSGVCVCMCVTIFFCTYTHYNYYCVMLLYNAHHVEVMRPALKCYVLNNAHVDKAVIYLLSEDLSSFHYCFI